MRIMDLFDNVLPPKQWIAPDACLLRGFALAQEAKLLAALHSLLARAPFRSMLTPMGMISIKTTSCGDFGWNSDSAGYYYSAINPANGQVWLPIPEDFLNLAQQAATAAGYTEFRA